VIAIGRVLGKIDEQAERLGAGQYRLDIASVWARELDTAQRA
jgi:hypothetical protein